MVTVTARELRLNPQLYSLPRCEAAILPVERASSLRKSITINYFE